MGVRTEAGQVNISFNGASITKRAENVPGGEGTMQYRAVQDHERACQRRVDEAWEDGALIAGVLGLGIGLML